MRAVRFIAAGLLVAGLVVAPAGAAVAVELPTTVLAPAAPPDFTPSPNKWREYILNITGRVLGGAMPDKWKAEQLANAYRYNHSWEGLAAQFGHDPANPNYAGAPDSYDDYILKKTEQDIQGGTKNKPMQAPATKPNKFAKTVGGALVGYTGFEVGTMFGAGIVNTVGGWQGFDANGVVCSQTRDEHLGNVALRLLSGQDCSMWDQAADYVPDSDSPTVWSAATYNGGSARLIKTFMDPGGANVRFGCYAFTAPTSLPAGVALMYRQSNGTYNQISNPSSVQGSGPCAGSRQLASGGTFVSSNAVLSWRTTAGATLVGTAAAEEHSEPDRFFECIIYAEDGRAVSVTGDTYKESDGFIPSPDCNNPPDDPTFVPESVVVNENMVGGNPDGTTKVTPVYSEPVTDEFKEWRENFPNCQTGACKLDLLVNTGAHPVSCFDLEAGCDGWFEDPAKATNYTCRYGIDNVDLEECAVYSGLFKPGRVAVGAPYSDPMTGSWSGGQTAPKLDGQAMGQAIQNPAAVRSCTGMAITGFDPVGFIMRPVQCALEWAFAPRPLVVEAELARADDAWAGKPPATIAAMVGGWSFTPHATGCSKTVTIFAGEFQNTIKPLDACPGSWLAPVADVSKIVSSLGLVVLGAIVLRRQIAGIVDYRGT